MTTINLKSSITDTAGIPMSHGDKPITLASILSNSLANQTEGDAIKLWDWAVALHKEGEISVDDSDLSFIRDFVKNSKTMTVLAKGQILKALA